MIPECWSPGWHRGLRDQLPSLEHSQTTSTWNAKRAQIDNNSLIAANSIVQCVDGDMKWVDGGVKNVGNDSIIMIHDH